MQHNKDQISNNSSSAEDAGSSESNKASLPGKKIFGFDVNVFWLSVVSFFTDISSEMIMPILPLFFVNTLKGGKALLGLMEGMAESLSSFLKYYSGVISDRIGHRKKLVIFGYAISNLTKPLFALSTSTLSVITIRMVDRVGKGIRTSPRDAMIVESSAANEIGRNFGFHRMMDNFGELLGPSIAALMLYLGYSYQNIFVLSAVPGILAVLIIIFFVKERSKGKQKDNVQHEIVTNLASTPAITPEKIRFSILKSQSPAFKIFMVSVLFFGFANFSKALLFPRAEELGTPIALIPLLFLFSPIMSTLIALPAGIIADRIGKKIVLVLGYTFFILMCLTFSLGTGLFFVGVGFLLHGIFFGLTDGVQRAYTAELGGEKSKATGLGIYHMIVGISILPANALAGLLWGLVGAEYMFAFSILLALVSIVILSKVKN